MLTSAEGYNPQERMIFSEPVPGSVPDSKPKIEFKRINISTRNEDGTVGELVISAPPKLFSFGVSESVNEETKKVMGYTFPLCMWNKEKPTDEEKAWTTTFEKIVNHCIDHLLETKEEIEMFELTRADLIKEKGGLNPLYWKKEKVKDEKTGKTVLRKVPGQGPTLYAKLIYSKKNNKFLSQFYDKEDKPIDPLDLMGKHCYTDSAVKIESIFISGTGKISLQVKLYEAVVELSGSGMKRLLKRPEIKSKVLAARAGQTNAASALANDDENGEDENADGDDQQADNQSEKGSLNEDAGDEEEAEAPVPAKVVPPKPVARTAPAKATTTGKVVRRVKRVGE
jgi:hypothetical protein